MFFVYILKSYTTDRFYIGYSTNIESRLFHHNSGLTRSTINGRPWKVVYSESFMTKTEALKREKFLKKQRNREFYNRLIIGA